MGYFLQMCLYTTFGIEVPGYFVVCTSKPGFCVEMKAVYAVTTDVLHAYPARRSGCELLSGLRSFQYTSCFAFDFFVQVGKFQFFTVHSRDTGSLRVAIVRRNTQNDGSALSGRIRTCEVRTAIQEAPLNNRDPLELTRLFVDCTTGTAEKTCCGTGGIASLLAQDHLD